MATEEMFAWYTEVQQLKRVLHLEWEPPTQLDPLPSYYPTFMKNFDGGLAKKMETVYKGSGDVKQMKLDLEAIVADGLINPFEEAHHFLCEMDFNRTRMWWSELWKAQPEMSAVVFFQELFSDIHDSMKVQKNKDDEQNESAERKDDEQNESEEERTMIE